MLSGGVVVVVTWHRIESSLGILQYCWCFIEQLWLLL